MKIRTIELNQNYNKNLEFALLAIFILIGVLTQHIGLILFGLLSTWIVKKALKDQENIYGYFLVAYILYLVVSLGIYYGQIALYGSQFIEGASDEVFYYNEIIELVKNYKISYLFSPGSERIADYSILGVKFYHTGFTFIMATIGFAFNNILGSGDFLYFAANAYFGALLIIVSYKIAQQSGIDTKMMKTTMLFLLCYPHLMFYNGILLKDTLVILVNTAIVYIFMFKKNKYIKDYFIATVLLYLGATLRFRMALATIGFIGFILIFPYLKKIKINTLPKKLIVFVVLLCIEVWLFVSGVFDNMIYYVHKTKVHYAESLESINGLTSLIPKLPPVIMTGAVFFTILIMPFSFWRSLSATNGTLIRRLFEDIGTFYWLLCIPFAVVGLIENFKEKKYNNNIYLATIFYMLVMAATLTMHIRWRLMIVPFYAVMIGIGITSRRKYSHTLKISYLGMLGLGLLYVVLKIGYTVFL